MAILGGGFAGVYCAKEIGKRLRAGRIVGLVSEENYMVFQPMLPEVAGGSLSPRHVVNPIRTLCKGTRVYKGEVVSIDPDERAINVDAGSYTPNVRFTYDHLVLALGATIDLRRIPGMAEHSLLIQNVGDAMKLRATIIGRLEEANLVVEQEDRRRMLDFVIVGGGYSGVETAGQIADLLNSINRYYKNVEADDYSVTLIHSRDVLLPTLSRKLGEYTADCLRDQKVKVILERRVKGVTARQVVLDDGTEIPAKTVVSTVGNAPHPAIVKLCDKFGIAHLKYRVQTDRYLRVAGRENLWAAGDCAAIPHPGQETGYCPDTAQFAMREGTRVGKNVVAKFKGDWLKPFNFKGLGELASIGHHTAVAHVMGLNFSGFIAWWMWRTIYLSKLPGLDRKLRVLAEWTFDVFFPRDINLLTPRYSNPLTEMYLEKGDVLFHSGEPAFSFYVVKDGRMEIRDDEGRVVHAIHKGGHFGERALLADKIWRFNAVAAIPSVLVAISDAVFQQLTSSSGSIGDLLTRSASTYKSQGEIAKILDRVPAEIRGKTAEAVMNRKPVVIKTEMTVGEVLGILQQYPHSVYAVVDEEKRITGILRRNEFYEWMKNATLDEEASIKDAPLDAVPTLTAESSVGDIIESLVRGAATKALVADKENRLLGIVTLIDLFTAQGGVPDAGLPVEGQ